jgi:type II secretory pathway pseudopilin PulG
MILAIIIAGIIAGIVGLVGMQGTRSFVSADARADLTTQGRLAIERMAREIRTIRSRADVTVMGGGTLSFVDMNGTPITFTSGGGVVTRNGTPLAAATAATLSFTYLRPDGGPAAAATLWSIQIDLTFTKGQERQAFRVRVHPRNF